MKRFAAPPIPVTAPRTEVLNTIQDRFGERVRKLRLEREMTQLQMAKSFGIDRSFISEIEAGHKSVSLHTLGVIARGMKMDVSELVQGL